MRTAWSPIRRFVSKFKVLPGKDSAEGCWQWIAAKNRYGVFYINGRDDTAHRASYLLFSGPIPERFEVNHKCRNVLCVNPAHLETLSLKDHKLVDRDIAVQTGKTNGLLNRKINLPYGLSIAGRHKDRVRSQIWDPVNRKYIWLGSLKLTNENIKIMSARYTEARIILETGDTDAVRRLGCKRKPGK